LSFSSCPPALLFDVNIPGCTEWFRESLIYLENDVSIKNVVLGFRYTSFLYGNQMDAYPDLPNQFKRSAMIDIYQNFPDQELRELYWQSLLGVIKRLRAAGKDVYIIYPVPEIPVHIEKAVLPYSVFGNKTMLNLDKAIAAQYYFARNEFILNKLDSLSYGVGLYAIKPFDILCDDYCPAVLDGQALYFDDNHLSIFGAAYLARDIVTESR